MKRSVIVSGLTMLLALCATAQSQKPQPKAVTTVAVTILSDRANVDDIIPTLRERIADEITGKGIRGIPLQGEPDTVMAEARNKGCDYVLRLKIMQVATASIVPGGSRPVGSVPGGTRSPGSRPEDAGLAYPGSHIAAEVKIGYKVLPTEGKATVVDDEMPLITEDPGPIRTDAPPDRGPYNYDPIAFRRLISNGTSGAAQAAMKKFRKKTGLTP